MTFHRATIKEITPRGALVEVPDFGIGQYFGPCQVITSGDYNSEDEVIVSTINDIKEDIVVIGPVSTDVPHTILDGNDYGEGHIRVEAPETVGSGSGITITDEGDYYTFATDDSITVTDDGDTWTFTT